MKDKNKLVVGLVMKSLQADFFKVMQRGAEAFAAAHDRVDLISVGTDSQTEVEAQIALVDRMADALCAHPDILLVRVASAKLEAYADVESVGLEVWRRPDPRS